MAGIDPARVAFGRKAVQPAPPGGTKLGPLDPRGPGPARSAWDLVYPALPHRVSSTSEFCETDSGQIPPPPPPDVGTILPDGRTQLLELREMSVNMVPTSPLPGPHWDRIESPRPSRPKLGRHRSSNSFRAKFGRNRRKSGDFGTKLVQLEPMVPVQGTPDLLVSSNAKMITRHRTYRLRFVRRAPPSLSQRVRVMKRCIYDPDVL